MTTSLYTKRTYAQVADGVKTRTKSTSLGGPSSSDDAPDGPSPTTIESRPPPIDTPSDKGLPIAVDDVFSNTKSRRNTPQFVTPRLKGSRTRSSRSRTAGPPLENDGPAPQGDAADAGSTSRRRPTCLQRSFCNQPHHIHSRLTGSSIRPTSISQLPSEGVSKDFQARHGVDDRAGSPLTDDSTPDSGAILDPEDASYRGKTTKNRVDSSATTSIIKTRSARVGGTKSALEPPSAPRKASSRRKVYHSSETTHDTPPAISEATPSSSHTVPVNHNRFSVLPITRVDDTDKEDGYVPDSESRRLKRSRSVKTVTFIEKAPSSSCDEADSRKRLRTTPLTGNRDDGDFMHSDFEMSELEGVELAPGDRGWNTDNDSLDGFIVPDGVTERRAGTDSTMSDVDDGHEEVVVPGDPKTSPPLGLAAVPTDDHVGHTQAETSSPSPTPLEALVTHSPKTMPLPSRKGKGRLHRPSAVGDSPMTVPPTPAPSPVTSSPSTPGSASHVPLKDSPPSTPKIRRSFALVKKNTPTKDRKIGRSGATTLLEDLYTTKVTFLPEKCEVTSEELQDALLSDYYPTLPKLKGGSFQSWSEAAGPGMVLFSQWGETCPDMDFETCLSIINFRAFDRYINPSRISPLDVTVQMVPGPRPKYNLCTSEHRVAMCLSPVMCVESHVIKPPERGLRQKWLASIFHSQEWERFVGFICMVFGHDILQAQLSKDAIQFTTRASFGGRSSYSSTPAQKRITMFSNIRSPSIASRTNAPGLRHSDPVTLEHDATIPVYDCRNLTMDFSRGVGDMDVYPLWEEEIPYGSFTVVAYTVTVFQSSSSNLWTVSLNLHWAMIMGSFAED